MVELEGVGLVGVIGGVVVDVMYVGVVIVCGVVPVELVDV